MSSLSTRNDILNLGHVKVWVPISHTLMTQRHLIVEVRAGRPVCSDHNLLLHLHCQLFNTPKPHYAKCSLMTSSSGLN